MKKITETKPLHKTRTKLINSPLITEKTGPWKRASQQRANHNANRSSIKFIKHTSSNNDTHPFYAVKIRFGFLPKMWAIQCACWFTSCWLNVPSLVKSVKARKWISSILTSQKQTRSNQFIDIFTSHEKIKQPKINEPGLPFIRNLSAKLLRVGHVVHIWHHSNHASSIAKLLHQPEIQTIILVNIKTYCHRSCCNNSIKILFTSIIPVNNLLS